jgi:uroporphyrin-III C-methyltransferase
MTTPGKVWLVGAGPGDPELLTVKAARVLGACDVVLADDLVSDGVLALAAKSARIVHVGKRGGCKSTPQAFIEKLLVAQARAGNIVVRLKGGDPFIFGRGGEECATLRAAGIDYEVVNGITAGVAAATAIGVPLTHRAHCHGAIFVTGHPGEGGEVDWANLAATGLPLVIYMGSKRAAQISASLQAAGMPAHTPAAVVSQATHDDERAEVTTLDGLAAAATRLRGPSILIVGEIVREAHRNAGHDGRIGALRTSRA